MGIHSWWLEVIKLVRKLTLAFILPCFFLSASVCAEVLSSTNYRQITSLTPSFGGKSGTSSFVSGKIQSSNYLSRVSMAISSTLTPSPTQDATPPTVNQIKVDTVLLNDNDIIKKNGTLTGFVTDDVRVDTAKSNVQIDSTTTYFSSLSGSATYEISSGILIFPLSLEEGKSYNLKINAYDTSNNLTTFARSIKTAGGELSATNLRGYPNPFNPDKEAISIGYQLTRDTNITIYVFNSLNQSIYKRDIPAGGEGAHVGYNEIKWDGKTSSGEMAGNDLYFCKVVSEGKVLTRCKIALIR